MSSRQIARCPFCDGDIGGCCFCDHSGRIYVGGEDDFFKSEQQLNDSLGVKYLKEQDRKQDLEPWPEMFRHFLDERNIPKSFKQTLTDGHQ